MSRPRIVFVGFLAILAIPSLALAGGWAMTSFDEVPDGFQAGATYHLEYTVLQHGKTPVDVGGSQVRIIDSNGKITTFDAVATGETGRYAVTITFPESGTWQWEVTQGQFAPHEMGAIEVRPPTSDSAASGSARPWLLPTALVLAIGLIALQGASPSRIRRPSDTVTAD